MQIQSLPYSTRHSEPRRCPRSPPESPGQPRNSHTTRTKKCKHTLKPIPTSQKPDKQWVSTRLICQTPYRWKPIPTHTNTPQHKQCSYPQNQPGHPSAHPKCLQKYHRICPVQAPPTKHTGKKTRMRGPHLLQYIMSTLCTRLTEGYLIYGYNLI